MKIKHARIMLVCCFVTLSGCQTGGVGMVGSPLWQVTASKEDKIKTFVSICESYGFKKNTKEMSQCVASESRSASQSAAKSLDNFNRNNRMSNTSTTCTQLGNTLNCNTW